MRRMPKERSSCMVIFEVSAEEKAGHPQPELNLLSELKSSVPHTMQR